MTSYIVLILFLVLAILVFYNGFEELYWIYRLRHNYSNTEYEYKKIRYYKRKLIIFLPMVIILGTIIFFYKVPISFDKIISLENQQKAHTALIHGNLPKNVETLKIKDNDVSEVLNTLKYFKYRRCIAGNTGGKGLFMYLCTDDNREIDLIEVWESGYIKMPNNRIYKVLSEDESELFNKLTKILE